MVFENILKPISYSLGIFAMFFIVIAIYAAKLDYDSQSYCNDAVQEFVDKSRTSGYISANNYNEMISKMTGTGNLYDVTIVHQSKVCYPGETDSDFLSNYYTYTKDEILDEIFNDSGTYKMKNGDYLRVSYSLKEATFGVKLYSFFTTHTYKSIRGSYGGYVGSAEDMGNMPEDITA